MGGVIGRYYLYQAAANANFFSPVFVVYYGDRVGLSLSAILAVQSSCLVLRAALDVPFGALADRWSRRGCLVVAALLQGAAAAALVVWPTLGVVWGAEATFAISAALRSGADSAFLFDALHERTALAHYPRAESRGQALAALSSGGAAIAGGLLAAHDIAWPYVATACSAGLWIVVAWSLGPDRRTDARRRPELATAVRVASRRPAVWWAIGFATWAVVGSHVYFYLQQPFLRGIGVPVAWFGVAFAATKVVTAVVATVAHRIDAAIGARGTSVSMTAVATAGLAGMATATDPAGAALLLTRGVLDGLWQPLTNVYMNRLVASDVRATMLSLQNFVARLTLGGVIGVTGFTTAASGLDRTLAGAAFAMACAGVVVACSVPRAVLAGAETCGTTPP